MILQFKPRLSTLDIRELLEKAIKYQENKPKYTLEYVEYYQVLYTLSVNAKAKVTRNKAKQSFDNFNKDHGSLRAA